MINYSYLSKFSDVLRKGIDRSSFADSLSNTQYISKSWLTTELSKIDFVYNRRIIILGGWFGSYLIPLLHASVKPEKIVLNDLNPDCLYFAEILHGKKNIKYECFDVCKTSNLIYSSLPDVVINTSCEHMHDMNNIIDKRYNCLYVFQSCNSTNDPGHINPKKTLEDFVVSTGLNTIVFYGTKDLGHKKRHMVIGYA